MTRKSVGRPGVVDREGMIPGQTKSEQGSMRILNRNVWGPSQYARFPVIRLELDLGALNRLTAKLGDGVHRRPVRGVAGPG